MGRRTSLYGCLPFLVLAAAFVGVTPGEAMSFALADRDREQAIRVGKKSIVQNERTALREEDGRYAAQCVYEFPTDGVDPKGRVVLVVKDADEREVAKFTVDLAAMR